MKVTCQLTNGNEIKRKIRNIKYRGKEEEREGGQVEPMPLAMV